MSRTWSCASIAGLPSGQCSWMRVPPFSKPTLPFLRRLSLEGLCDFADEPPLAPQPLLLLGGLFSQFKSPWCLRRSCTTWTPARSLWRGRS